MVLAPFITSDINNSVDIFVSLLKMNRKVFFMFFIPEKNKRVSNQEELVEHFPDVSFPVVVDHDFFRSKGVYVLEDVKPEFNPITHQLKDIGQQLRDGKYFITYEVTPLSEEIVALNVFKAKKEVVKKFEDALDNHLDSIAQIKGYSNRITCALRAGYPGPYQAETQPFAIWMDECNQHAYSLLAEVNAGTRSEFATTQEFIDLLPKFSWPTTPT